MCYSKLVRGFNDSLPPLTPKTDFPLMFYIAYAQLYARNWLKNSSLDEAFEAYLSAVSPVIRER